MSADLKLRDLIQEVEKTAQVLAKILRFHDEFMAGDFVRLGRTRLTGIGLAEIFDNYYTCLETLFVRISQFYGNGLQGERWHADLLHKMTLSIPESRAPVLADKTAAILQEFLRFRHFRRYYFEFEYDWDKLDYLGVKLQQARVAVSDDLSRFKGFLAELLAAAPRGKSRERQASSGGGPIKR